RDNFFAMFVPAGQSFDGTTALDGSVHGADCYGLGRCADHALERPNILRRWLQRELTRSELDKLDPIAGVEAEFSAHRQRDGDSAFAGQRCPRHRYASQYGKAKRLSR